MSNEETSDGRQIQRLDGRAPRGLGRGLSALLGDAEHSQTTMRAGKEGGLRDANAREIGIDQIIRNHNQPRRRFNEEDLRTLADSIATHGVLQPLLLRPLDDNSGRYEIVAGERRWRAAQLAGLHQVPALVRKFDDLGMLEVAIVENVQRADLNAIEEAQAYQQLIDRFGRTQQSIADSVGKSRAHIANTVRLTALPEEIMNDVREGRLTAGHARAILGSTDMANAARVIIAKGLSVRDAEKLVTDTSKKSARRVSRETHLDGDSKALAYDLSAALGLDVGINVKSAQAGNITISYNNLEQLDDICRRLTSSAKWTEPTSDIT
jgi:ParB family transcriptional regulator, chromosome partitioning protein